MPEAKAGRVCPWHPQTGAGVGADRLQQLWGGGNSQLGAPWLTHILLITVHRYDR